MTIEDDGRGGDADRVSAHGFQEQNFGLLRMKERTALPGGSITIRATPCKGARIGVEIPWREASATPEQEGTNRT